MLTTTCRMWLERLKACEDVSIEENERVKSETYLERPCGLWVARGGEHPVVVRKECSPPRACCVVVVGCWFFFGGVA